MEIRNVYVIVGLGYTREKVEKELKEEKYSHNFCFGHVRMNPISARERMKEANEVWCFGMVDYSPDYKVAKEMRKDIWKMG